MREEVGREGRGRPQRAAFEAANAWLLRTCAHGEALSSECAFAVARSTAQGEVGRGQGRRFLSSRPPHALHPYLLHIRRRHHPPLRPGRARGPGDVLQGVCHGGRVVDGGAAAGMRGDGSAVLFLVARARGVLVLVRAGGDASGGF